jgi:hypothetical protein
MDAQTCFPWSSVDELSEARRKKIMKNLDKRTPIRLQAALVLLPSLPALGARIPRLTTLPALAPEAAPGDFRFPPTRAARASRSRGVFLKDSDGLANPRRSRWLEPLAVLGTMVVAVLALAVCVNTTSTVASTAFGAVNPGPAMVAATSVAPHFVLPLQAR